MQLCLFGFFSDGQRQLRNSLRPQRSTSSTSATHLLPPIPTFLLLPIFEYKLGMFFALSAVILMDVDHWEGLSDTMHEPPLRDDNCNHGNPFFAVSAHPHQRPHVGDWHSREGGNRNAGPLGGSAEAGTSGSLADCSNCGGQWPMVLPHNHVLPATTSASGLAAATPSVSTLDIPISVTV